MSAPIFSLLSGISSSRTRTLVPSSCLPESFRDVELKPAGSGRFVTITSLRSISACSASCGSSGAVSPASSIIPFISITPPSGIAVSSDQESGDFGRVKAFLSVPAVFKNRRADRAVKLDRSAHFDCSEPARWCCFLRAASVPRARRGLPSFQRESGASRAVPFSALPAHSFRPCLPPLQTAALPSVPVLPALFQIRTPRFPSS